MDKKDKQPYISYNEFGSREECEIHEQRIKELGNYNGSKNKKTKNKIIFFTTKLNMAIILFFTIWMYRKNTKF